MTNENKSRKDSSVYVGLLLAAITFCCLSIVFAVKGVTAEKIMTENAKNQSENFRLLLKGVKFNNNPNAECYLADGFGSSPKKVYVARLNGKVSAYVVYYDVAGGYSTPFSMVAGVNADGTVNRVDVVDFNETPGLGDKILRSNGSYLDGFNGVSLANRNFDVKKYGGDFDFFTGATVTPRAVVRSTKSMLERLGSVDLDSLTKCEDQ